LDIYSSNAGTDYAGLGLLLQDNQVSKLTSTYIGENSILLDQYLTGKLTIECIPQGTLAEKLRSGGAGIPAFYCKAGLGTVIETGGFPLKYSPEGRTVEIVSQPKER
jgi:3-oxoacid CoA-transferase subunit A